jgi:hypothetical protein
MRHQGADGGKESKNGFSISRLWTGFYCLGEGLLRICGLHYSRKLVGQLHRCQFLEATVLNPGVISFSQLF